MNNINHSSFTSIEQVTNQYLNNQTTQSTTEKTFDGLSFEDILKQSLKNSELKFSKHAAQRLDDRNISLTPDQSLRLEEGVAKAGLKGIRDSLVIVDSLAFIVNVPNQTVVTAMDQTESDGDKIFTNIDGAVIV